MPGHTRLISVFGDERSVGLQQDQEEIEGACPQLYRHAVDRQFSPARQNAETAEPNDGVAAAIHPRQN